MVGIIRCPRRRRTRRQKDTFEFFVGARIILAAICACSFSGGSFRQVDLVKAALFLLVVIAISFAVLVRCFMCIVKL